MEESWIFQEIMNRFHKKKDIEDEWLFFLLERMSERFVESHDDSEWQTYDRLLDTLDKIWQYKQFDTLTSEQSYLYGGIWGCLSILSHIKHKKETSQKCYTIASKYETDSAFAFLRYIYDNPGVQNKKLAQICNVSSARISQISSDALKDGLISSQTLGKEKSYYIRTMGESVLNIVKKNRSKYAVNMNNYSGCKVTYISNKEKGFLPVNMKLHRSAALSNWTNNGLIVFVPLKKQDKMEPIKEYVSRNERKNTLWKHEMCSLSNNAVHSLSLLMGAGLINQQ